MELKLGHEALGQVEEQGKGITGWRAGGSEGTGEGCAQGDGETIRRELQRKWGTSAQAGAQ